MDSLRNIKTTKDYEFLNLQALSQTLLAFLRKKLLSESFARILVLNAFFLNVLSLPPLPTRTDHWQVKDLGVAVFSAYPICTLLLQEV